MGYIGLADLVADMTPAQKIFVQQFYSKYDIGSGIIRRKIINVEPLWFQGLLAGTEFNNFVNTKVYLALEVKFSSTGIVPGVVIPYALLADEVDVSFFVCQNVSLVWDVTAVAMKYQANDIYVNNVIFWHLQNQIYTDISFSGYRITLGTV